MENYSPLRTVFDEVYIQHLHNVVALVFRHCFEYTKKSLTQQSKLLYIRRIMQVDSDKNESGVVIIDFQCEYT